MTLFLFRLLETALLLAVVTLHITPTGYQYELAYPHFGLSFQFSGDSTAHVLNSLVFGFALSLFTTLALYKGKKNVFWVLSLLIALTGFAGHTNEIVRLFYENNLQIIIDLSLVLLVLDWLLMFGKKVEPKKVITPEERIAAMSGEGAGE